LTQTKCLRCAGVGFLIIEDVELRAIKECPVCKGNGMDAEEERDLWIKRWNTVKNFVIDNQQDGDRSNPEIGTLLEVEALMETLEETFNDVPVGGSAANNSEEE
jgi:hypothetical protein